MGSTDGKVFLGSGERNAKEFGYGFVDDLGDGGGGGVEAAAAGSDALALPNSDTNMPTAGRALTRHGGMFRPVTRWQE